MLYARSTAALAGLAVVATLAAPGALAPAQADGVRTFNCVGGRTSVSCVSTWRQGVQNPHIIPVPGPTSDLEIAEAKQRDRLWETYCKPSVRHDEYGVPRYAYAAYGCEYGRDRD